MFGEVKKKKKKKKNVSCCCGEVNNNMLLCECEGDEAWHMECEVGQ